MKAEVQDIMDNWKEHNFSRLYHPSFQGQPGWIGEEKCEEMVQAFGKEVLKWIDHYFGAWLLPPLSLGELLLPDRPGWAYQTAKKLVRDHGSASPASVPDEVWAAIKSLAQREHGSDMDRYTVKCDGGRRVSLTTYLGAVYWVICLTNVDSEAAFSIVGHMLKRAPASGLASLSAHLSNTKNPDTVTAKVYEDKLNDPEFKAIKQNSYRKVKAKTAKQADAAGHMEARALTEKTHGKKLELTLAEQAKLQAAIAQGNAADKKRESMRQTGVTVEAIEDIDADNTLRDYGHEDDEVFDGTEGDVEHLEGEAACAEGDVVAESIAAHLNEQSNVGEVHYTCIQCKKEPATTEATTGWYCQACFDDCLLEDMDIGCTTEEAMEKIEGDITKKANMENATPGNSLINFTLHPKYHLNSLLHITSKGCSLHSTHGAGMANMQWCSWCVSEAAHTNTYDLNMNMTLMDAPQQRRRDLVSHVCMLSLHSA